MCHMVNNEIVVFVETVLQKLKTSMNVERKTFEEVMEETLLKTMLGAQAWEYKQEEPLFLKRPKHYDFAKHLLGTAAERTVA